MPSTRLIPTSRVSRVAIASVWAACAIFGAFYAPKFLTTVTLRIDAPDFAPSHKAAVAYADSFAVAAAGFEDALVVMVSVPDGSAVVTEADGRLSLIPPADSFSRRLRTWVEGQLPSSWLDDSTFTSFESFHSRNMSILEGLTLSDREQPQLSKATIIRIQPPHHMVSSFAHSLQGQVNLLSREAEAEYGGGVLKVQLAGYQTLVDAVQDAVEEDAQLMDMVSLPIAIVVLAYMLRTVRMLLIPLLNMLIVVATSFAIMYFVSLSLPIASVVPPFMLSVTIAMSIDYSLFMLSRFREEIRPFGASAHLQPGVIPTAVKHMQLGAGHTVLVSGSTLAICFLGLLPLPLSLLATTGLGAALTVTIAVMVNLSLTPTLLLTFPAFFSELRLGGVGCLIPAACRRRLTAIGRSRDGRVDGFAPSAYEPFASPTADGEESVATAGANGGSVNSPNGGSAEPVNGGSAPVATENKPNPPKRSAWETLAHVTRRFALLIIVIVVAVAVPCALQALRIQTSIDFELLLPHGASATTAYTDLVHTFGTAAVDPYVMLMTPLAANGSVATQPFFDDVNFLVRFLGARNGSDSKPLLELRTLRAVTGTADPDKPGGWEPVPAFVWKQVQMFHIRQLELQWEQQVSADERMMTISIELDFDPYTQRGKVWLSDMRDALHVAAELPRFKPDAAVVPVLDVASVHLAGGAGQMLDAQAALDEFLPLTIGLTLGIVFVLVALAFRSLLVPLRAVFSIALTLGWVYGLLVLIYQDGALDWTGIFAFRRSPLGISWLSPVIAFACMVGLGLDYDIFLLTRIYEYRLAGASDAGAIGDGLVHSGNVITAAGVIMAVAFTGLLLPTTVAFNQLATMLILSVLLDTFVVRTLLLPSIMNMLGRANWWPRRMPPEKPLAHLEPRG